MSETNAIENFCRFLTTASHREVQSVCETLRYSIALDENGEPELCTLQLQEDLVTWAEGWLENNVAEPSS